MNALQTKARSARPARRAASGRIARLALAAGVGLGLLAAPALASIPYPPNDTYFSSQWALRIIKAPQAWTVSTGAGIAVAVVDTGVQFGIPDLPASKSAGSYSCLRMGGSPNPCPADGSGDGEGHGTWVASIVAAATNNGVGIAGVAPDARILSIKAIAPDGTGSVDDISKGIEFAADLGAKVINLSVGPDSFAKNPPPPLECPPQVVGGCLTPPINDAASLHKALQPAVDYAWQRGALVVVSAGNTSPDAGPGPSLYLGMSNLLIVGATGPRDEVASYSNTGSGPTFVWAPGGDGACSSGDTSNCITIASMSGGYQVSEGTSFAAPHVSGVAALLMAQGSSNAAAASRIVSSADQIAAGARLDAASAVGASSAAPPVTQPAPAVTAPVTRTAPQSVAPRPASTLKPTAKAATPSPTPTPSVSPTHSGSPTTDPTPLAAAAVSPSPRPSTVALGRHTSSTSGSPQTLALVLFLAVAGGVAFVWLGRRVRV